MAPGSLRYADRERGIDVDESRTRGLGGDPGLQAVRTLADRLRADGVVSVASPLLALARPAGVDLLHVLPVLAAELAHEWRCAADALTVLHPDRLQLLSAAALIGHGAQEGGLGANAAWAPPRRVDPETLARAVVLRHAVQAPDDGRTLDEGNLLLDRTWAVLADLRRQATGTARDGAATDASAIGTGAGAEAEIDPGSRLPAHLDAAAATGALIGLLAPWLPPPRVEPVSRIDGLLTAVSTLARRHQDEPWWLAMTALGTCAATITVAGAYAVATHPGTAAAAVAQTLSDSALLALVDDALRAARSLGSEPGMAAPLIEAVRPGVVAVSVAPPEAPAPSPSQQARAAAERAAAERAATQQAFVERATANRAAARATAAGAGSTGAVATPTPAPAFSAGPAASTGTPRSTDMPASPAAGSAPVVADSPGAHEVAPGSTAATSVPSVTIPSAGLPSARSAPDGASVVPPIAQVRADLGETDETVQLGVWDTLMGPR